MRRKAIVSLRSDSPYSQGKYINPSLKKDKENSSDFEDRIWRERLHYDENNEVYIPSTQFSNCLKVAAKFLSIQIPGKGKATYTKHFDAGVMVTSPLKLGIHKDEVACEDVLVPSDGRRGGTTRVIKHFPIIFKWSGDVVYQIFDDTITESIFQYVLEQSGELIGIGRFRPINRGWYGCFIVENIKWES